MGEPSREGRGPTVLVLTRLAAAVLIAASLGGLYLSGRAGDHPDLHTILDTTLFLLFTALAALTWMPGPATSTPIGHRAFAAILVAVLYALHALTSLPWTFTFSAQLRPLTWPPASYLMPATILLGILFGRAARPSSFAFPAATFAVTLALVGAFMWIPPYTPPILGVTRPSLLLVPVLWALVATVCWSNRERSPSYLLPLAVASVPMFTAHVFMLFSRAAHDSMAMAAHVGVVVGVSYLLLHQVLSSVATYEQRTADERAARLLSEQLEARVRERTLQLEKAQRRATALYRVTSVLAESHSLVEAAPALMEAIGESAGAPFAALWELDRQDQMLRSSALWHRPGEALRELARETAGHTFASGEGLPGLVVATREPVLVDLAQDARRSGACAAAGLQGAFGFPIIVRETVVAVLEFLGPEVSGPDRDLLEVLTGVGGQISRFIEHKSAETQLAQAQKMEAIGQLAGGIAHDFNNLLGVIIGYAELAAKELGPGHRTYRRLEAIDKAGKKAVALTRQILTFSRHEPVRVQTCDLNQLVEDMEKMLRRLIGEDVRLVVVLPADPCLVRADPNQLEQVIMNLAVNARDAMPHGGRLVIEAGRIDLTGSLVHSRLEMNAGPYVMLAVSDSGVGMAPGTVERIFEPFFTTKAAGKGTGLGLAVVYGVVKQAGGSISVYSEPGRGTTFKVYLPRDLGTEVLAEEPLAGEAPGGSETVLLVEDEDGLRAIIAESLRLAGYTVIEAKDSPSALLAAAQGGRPIHLVLSDVILPGAPGTAAAAEIRLRVPGVKALLMSGYTDRLLERDGDTPFIGKPFRLDDLLRKVREVLDGASSGGDATASGR